MSAGIQTVIYPVRDLAQAKRLFSGLLGVAPSTDEPYYVGYRVANQDIGLDPSGHQQGMTGPIAYVHVDDIEQRIRALLEAGAVVRQPVGDVGAGRLIATVDDADGNVIGLLQDA